MSQFCSVLLALVSCAQGEPVEVPAFHPLLERKDLGRWSQAHEAAGTEMPWHLKPWSYELAQGTEQAWHERRPLLIWLEEGHPFAAVPARALAVRDLWTARELAAPLRPFVLAADDLSEILRRNGAAAAWLRRLAGDAVPLRPGIYLATADARLLGSCDGLDAAATAAALTAALTKWEALAAELPVAAPPERPGPLPREMRDADSFPLDGIAFLLFHHRLYDSASGPPRAFDGNFTRDFLWGNAAEAAAVGRDRQPGGAAKPWPPALALRFAQTVLADASEGAALSWSAEDFQLFELQSAPQAIRRGRARALLTGRFLAHHGGTWKGRDEDPFGSGQWFGKQPDARGARGLAVGWMELEASTGRVLSCQIQVVAQHFDKTGVREAAVQVRNLVNGEEGLRYAPRMGVGAAAPPAGAVHRTLFAEQSPEPDGSLAETVWLGSPWTQDFAGAPGTRAKAVWNTEHLFLSAWAGAPELEVEITPPGGAKGLRILLKADGSVTGMDGARCVVQSHGEGAAQAWVFEALLPWSNANLALKREAPPAAGEVWRAAWRAGAGKLTTMLVLEPSRAATEVFGGSAFGPLK